MLKSYGIKCSGVLIERLSLILMGGGRIWDSAPHTLHWPWNNILCWRHQAFNLSLLLTSSELFPLLGGAAAGRWWIQLGFKEKTKRRILIKALRDPFKSPLFAESPMSKIAPVETKAWAPLSGIWDQAFGETVYGCDPPPTTSANVIIFKPRTNLASCSFGIASSVFQEHTGSYE